MAFLTAKPEGKAALVVTHVSPDEDADVDDDNRIPDAEITRDIVLTKERETAP